MSEKRVVITGLGVISSIACGREDFARALFNGASGAKDISLFDVSSFKVKTAAEIKDFQPQDYLGTKGLRTLDRSTKLVNSAAKLALDDAGLTITEENTLKAGVVIGTTMGSVHSISEFDREAIKEGPHYVNPALFPNTVINSPASQISIKFNIRGFNSTISTGFAASLDAINYAADFIRLGRAEAVLAGGVEELCLETFMGFYKSNCLAGLKGGSVNLSCPFDRRRNGVVLGEGSAVLVLEDLEAALRRRANIYAEVRGFGMGFEPFQVNKYNSSPGGLKKAMLGALKQADIAAEDVDYICAGANSTPDGDSMEARAIGDLFNKAKTKAAVSAVKSMLGECYSASGSLQVASAVCVINKQAVPPTINFQEKDLACDLNLVVNKPESRNIDKVLINAFGPSGCNSSLVISKFAS